MIDWSELESALEAPEDGPGARQGVKLEGEVKAPRGTLQAVEHWRRNLERFPRGHIGHEYAKEAIEHLTRFDKKGDLEV